MDEVEAVTQAVNEVIGDGDTSLEASRAFAERIARAAIAALDACRLVRRMVREPDGAFGKVAGERARIIEADIAHGNARLLIYRSLMLANKEGREAGLREAAAVPRQRRERVACNGWTVGPHDLEAVEADILALIDAGKTPGPSQPEPGAALSPGHEGA